MDLTLQSARMTLRGQKLKVGVQVRVNLGVDFQNGFRSKWGERFFGFILNDHSGRSNSTSAAELEAAVARPLDLSGGTCDFAS